ncbi:MULTISPECIES: hypothetical protein [Yersinia]|uniref:hypothetical protein n=1 Tax=Yersinia TaxID=629 RepID=UPI001CFE881C|nr:hypothetical protein [Yersinia intermedia]ELX2276446.1 hypothetical protein [Yersinia enterocolitica]MCB5311496.1 hypothetical protein [Yersinia intermedia]MCB5325615.1 hypothetical protein [Yersinia intermedia]
MKKILAIAVIVIFVATLCWLLESKAEKKDVALPINTPLIITSKLAGKCRVTAILTMDGTDQKKHIACKVQLISGD